MTAAAVQTINYMPLTSTQCVWKYGNVCPQTFCFVPLLCNCGVWNDVIWSEHDTVCSVVCSADKHVNSSMRKQPLMSTLLRLSVYSQGRGSVKLHHLGGYLCTSWQEGLRVCVCMNMSYRNSTTLWPTQRDRGPLKGEGASVWHLKIDWRVCEMTAARVSAWRAFCRGWYIQQLCSL